MVGANNKGSDRPQRLASTFYFLYFAAGAALLPFLSLHYRQLGFSGRQIGVLIAIMPLSTLFGASLWSALADATRQRHRLVLAAIAGAWLAALLLLAVDQFNLLIPVIAVYAFFVAPIVPMADSAVLHLLGRRQAEYGRLRMWGAVGWGLAAPVAGILIGRGGSQWAFYIYLVLMVAVFLVTVLMPFGGATMSGRFSHSLRILLANRQWLVFLFVVLLEGMAFSITLNFLFLYMEELGASELLMGLTLTFATFSEIPVWRYVGGWLLRWGARALIILSLAAMIVRSFAYGMVTVGWLFLLISLLHGPAFAAMWSAGVATANETAPPGLGATAQGIFSGTVMGLGAGLGALVGGILFDAIGPAQMFRLLGLGLMGALLLYLVFGGKRVPLAPAPAEP